MTETLIDAPARWPIVGVAFVASLVAGLGTALGALPVFVLRRLSPRIEDALLGFAAGIMLVASLFFAHPAGAGGRRADDRRARGGGGDRGHRHLAGRGGAVADPPLRAPRALHPRPGRPGGCGGPAARVAFRHRHRPAQLPRGHGGGGGLRRRGAAQRSGPRRRDRPAEHPRGLGRRRVDGCHWPRSRRGLRGGVRRRPVRARRRAVRDHRGHRGGSVAAWGLAFAAGAMLFIISDEIIPRDPPARARGCRHLFADGGVRRDDVAGLHAGPRPGTACPHASWRRMREVGEAGAAYPTAGGSC